MTRQRDLFRPMCATVIGHQGELFDQGGRSSGYVCEVCHCHLEHTPSGFLACPRGHGKLMDPETVAWRARGKQDEHDDDQVDTWPEDARRIAARHRDHARHLGQPWRCECGACRHDREDDRRR